MASGDTLTQAELKVFFDTLCCLCAADSHLSGSEVRRVTQSLRDAGVRMADEEMHAAIQSRCRELHKEGVDIAVARLCRVIIETNSPRLGSLIQKTVPALILADGKESSREKQVADRLLEASHDNALTQKLPATPPPSPRMSDAHKQPQDQQTDADAHMPSASHSPLAPATSAAGRTDISPNVPQVVNREEDKFANPPTIIYRLKDEYTFVIKPSTPTSAGVLSENFKVNLSGTPKGIVMLSLTYEGSEWFFLRSGYVLIKVGAKSHKLEPVFHAERVRHGGGVIEQVNYGLAQDLFHQLCRESTVPIRVVGKPIGLEGELRAGELNVMRAFYNNCFDRQAFVQQLASWKPQSNKACFVVTATFGDECHPHVIVLREFREKCLRRHGFGRLACDAYDVLGPLAARIISMSHVARFISRWAIVEPAVHVAQIMLKLRKATPADGSSAR